MDDVDENEAGETIHDGIFDVKDLEDIDQHAQEDDGDQAFGEYTKFKK